jgi:hypothetical protein
MGIESKDHYGAITSLIHSENWALNIPAGIIHWTRNLIEDVFGSKTLSNILNRVI